MGFIDLNGKKKKGGGPLGLPKMKDPKLGNWGKGVGAAFAGAGRGASSLMGGATDAFGGLLGGASSSITTPLLIGGVLLAAVTVYALNRGSSVAERVIDNPEALKLAASMAAGPEMAAASALSGAMR
jgi:hypothetical protein